MSGVARVAAVLAAVVAVVAAIGATAVWWVDSSLSSNIEVVQVRVDGDTGPSAANELPPDQVVVDVPGGDEAGKYYLILGSDTRVGVGNGAYGDAGAFGDPRSDTTMLAYLPADKSWARLVSIPRDLVVSIPTERKACGAVGYSETTRFNEAMSRGGVPCVVATLEDLIPGLHVDHAVVVDFVGFANIVDALGGVEVCLTQPVYDQAAKADLPAGVSVLNGEEFLALARARKSVADGSDIERIKRQQYLVQLVVDQVRTQGVTTDPAKMFAVAEAATKSLATDEALASVTALVELGSSLQGLSSSEVYTATFPWIPDPANPMSTVVSDPDRAGEFVEGVLAGKRPERPAKSAVRDSTAGSASLFCK